MRLPRSVWIIGAVADKIVSQVTKAPGGFEPIYAVKCQACDTEHDEAPEDDACQCGSRLLSKPSPLEYKRLNAILRRPNTDAKTGNVRKTWKDLVRDTAYYLMYIDEWYWEVLHDGEDVVGFDVLSAEYIRQVVPGERYHCPACLSKQRLVFKGAGERCDCGAQVVETVYVQINDTDKVVMAWAKGEILHGNTKALGTSMYGEPSLQSVFREAQTIGWTSAYLWSAYSMNKRPGKLISFPGMTQGSINIMMEELLTFKAAHPEIRRDAWLGVQAPPAVVDLMGDNTDLSMLQLRKDLAEEVALRFGVSMQFLGRPTPGKLGDETENMDGSFDTVREIQGQIEEFINTQILPLFPEITAWEYRLGSPRPADEQKAAQFRATQAGTFAQLKNAGVEATMDMDFDINITGMAAPNAGATPGAYAQAPQPYPLSPTQASVEKALTPRWNPELVSGLATLEKAFMGRLAAALETVARKVNKGADPVMLASEFEDWMVKATTDYALETYQLSFESESSDMVKAAFEQPDRNALDALLTSGEGMLTNIRTQSKGTVSALFDELKRMYGEPGGMDVKAVTDRLVEVAQTKRSDIERIVRSETTRITNEGRARHWEKYPEFYKDAEYDWTISENKVEGSPCPICNAIAKGGTAKVGKKVYGPYKGNPYPLEELRRITNGFLPHPRCKDVVSRRTQFSEIGKGFQKARIYLKPGEKAPEGARVQQGPQGGHYYETGPGKPAEGESEADTLFSNRQKIGNPKFNTLVGDKGEELVTQIPGIAPVHRARQGDFSPELMKKYHIANDCRNAPFDLFNGELVEVKTTQVGQIVMWPNQIRQKQSFATEYGKAWNTIYMNVITESSIDVYIHEIEPGKFVEDKEYIVNRENSKKIGSWDKSGNWGPNT